MNLTPEQVEQGRRNFLKVLAGTPALAALGVSGGAQRTRAPAARCASGFIGVGGQGRVAARQRRSGVRRGARALRHQPEQPQGRRRGPGRQRRGRRPRHYADWQEMLQKEDIEAVIMAPPLWVARRYRRRLPRRRQARAVREDDGVGRAELRAHARRGAQERQGARDRLPAPVQARCIRPPTTASSRPASLGDIYHVRLAWHRNGNWRRKGEPPSPDYDPVEVGLSRLRSPAQLALVLEVLAGPDGRALQPPDQRRQLVPRRRAGSGHRLGRRLPLPGRRPRGPRPRLRDLRLSRRPHGGVLVDRVERVRRLLRDVHGHQGHAHPAPRARRRSSSRKAAPRAGRRRSRSTPRTGGPAAQSSETHERQHAAGGGAGGATAWPGSRTCACAARAS